MDIQATCGCGAKITISPGSPQELGNAHGYTANNNATVDAERQAVAEAFVRWIDAHQQCNRPLPERCETTGPVMQWPVVPLPEGDKS